MIPSSFEAAPGLSTARSPLYKLVSGPRFSIPGIRKLLITIVLFRSSRQPLSPLPSFNSTKRRLTKEKKPPSNTDPETCPLSGPCRHQTLLRGSRKVQVNEIKQPVLFGGSFSHTHCSVLLFKFEWRGKLHFLSGKWKTKMLAPSCLTHEPPGKTVKQLFMGYAATQRAARPLKEKGQKRIIIKT